MRHIVLPCVAAFALFAQPAPLMAQGQSAPTEAPEPKMPPMPSMEGQQGDVSKPVTQIPPRKKAMPAAGAKAGPGSNAAATPGVAAKPRAAKRKAVRPHPARGRRKR